VRRHATEALGTAAQKTDAATMPLAAMLNDENDVVRRNAALALARIGDLAAEAVPALTEALREPHYYVRGFSVQALRRIATPEATAALLHYLEATRWDSAQ
ncbi:HEAT repeat domain-containing protein, partial [Candidatus Poribacteria bacterium]|nr:HEAT repeat domain-containing protein [Candidatus Poribacteria bacterium]